MLELPAMKPVKARQKEFGMIANIDKPLIIEKIREVFLSQDSMSQFKQTIDNRYVKVKMALLLGKGEEAFEQYLKYNTNISMYIIIAISAITMLYVASLFIKILQTHQTRIPYL